MKRLLPELAKNTICKAADTSDMFVYVLYDACEVCWTSQCKKATTYWWMLHIFIVRIVWSSKVKLWLVGILRSNIWSIVSFVVTNIKWDGAFSAKVTINSSQNDFLKCVKRLNSSATNNRRSVGWEMIRLVIFDPEFRIHCGEAKITTVSCGCIVWSRECASRIVVAYYSSRWK